MDPTCRGQGGRKGGTSVRTILFQGSPAPGVIDRAYARVAHPQFFQRMACFELEDFQSAKEAFEAGLALEKPSRSFKMWIRKCDAELECKHRKHAICYLMLF